jgi:hypothetical protein
MDKKEQINLVVGGVLGWVSTAIGSFFYLDVSSSTEFAMAWLELA